MTQMHDITFAFIIIVKLRYRFLTFFLTQHRIYLRSTFFLILAKYNILDKL